MPKFMPLPKDKNGKFVTIGSMVSHESLRSPAEVTAIGHDRYGRDWVYYYDGGLSGEDDVYRSLLASECTTVVPDTWDAIEKTAYHLVMSEYLDDPERDVKALIERCKALATKEDN